jgi:uncharacterized protein (UPF0332 family)
MAIINTLEKCLDSPYLVRDPEAPARVNDLLALAHQRLEAAEALFKAGELGDVGTLAYEAMFAGLRALVYRQGYREAGLRCLLLACEEHYVRPGQLDPGHLQAFERAQGLKLTPAEACSSAAAFLARTRELLAV